MSVLSHAGMPTYFQKHQISNYAHEFKVKQISKIWSLFQNHTFPFTVVRCWLGSEEDLISWNVKAREFSLYTRFNEVSITSLAEKKRRESSIELKVNSINRTQPSSLRSGLSCSPRHRSAIDMMIMEVNFTDIAIDRFKFFFFKCSSPELYCRAFQSVGGEERALSDLFHRDPVESWPPYVLRKHF